MSIAQQNGLSPGIFRLVLASLVVFDHFSGVMLGRAAVFVFFILSGFWISRMWRERYALGHSPYVTFVVSRLWRLMPTMLAATAFAACIFIGLGAAGPLGFAEMDWGHLTFSSVFFIGYAELASPRLVEPAWSLDIEMRFYLIAPLMLIALRLIGAGWFLILAFAIFAVSVFAPVPGVPLGALGFKYLVWFAIGIAAEHARWSPARWMSTISLAGFVGVIAIALLAYPEVLTQPQLNARNLQLNWALALVAAPYAIATCLGASDKRDRTLGDLSYAVYLIHWPVFAVLFVTELVSPLTIAASLIVIGAVSWVVLRYIDQPIQKMRARWVDARGQNAKPAVQPAV